MEMPKIINWAKAIKAESREKRLTYDPRRLPKIDAYVDMIIDRGDHIVKETIRMNRYMEEIQDALAKLETYGVRSPLEQKQNRVTENPLRPT